MANQEIEETLEPQPHGGALIRNKKNQQVPIEYEPSLESADLEQEAKKVITPEDFATLQLISKYLSKDGMRLQEACLLANVEMDVLKAKIEKYPIIAKVIQMKEMEYKHMLIRQLSIRARGGDDKMATWLLESRYPDEFKPKGKSDPKDGENLMAQAISFIQESGDSAPLVKKATFINIKRSSNASPEVKALQSFLN